MTTVQISKNAAMQYIRPAAANYWGRYYFCPACADGRGGGFRYLEPSRAWNPCSHYFYAWVPILRVEVEIRQLFEAFLQELEPARGAMLQTQWINGPAPDPLTLLTAEEQQRWARLLSQKCAWLAEQWRLALNDLPNALGWTARDVWGGRQGGRAGYVVQKPQDTVFVWVDG